MQLSTIDALTKRPKGLSLKQLDMLRFIKAFIRENDYPPSIREIQVGCGISSTSVVDYNLSALQRAGHLHQESGIARGIRLIGNVLRTGFHCPTCSCEGGLF